MSAQTDGTNWLSLASVPQATHTCVGWVRVDTDVGTMGFVSITNQFTAQNRGKIGQNAGGDFRFEHDPTDFNSSTVVVVEGEWKGFAWTYQGESTPGSSADGEFSCWLLEEGSALSGFDETLTPSTAESDNTPNGIAIGSDQTDQGGAQITVAMVKVFESVLTPAQMLTELQYRNPQLSAWRSYVFRNGALTTDDSGNGGDLTNNTGGGSAVAFVSAEPSDIIGDDPAAGGSVSKKIVAVVGRTMEKIGGLWLPEGAGEIWTPPEVPGLVGA